jgi:hypothetical protein
MLLEYTEHSLRVSENRVLKRTFGPKRDKVTGDLRQEITGHWMNVHFEELRNLHNLQVDQVTENEMVKACNIHGKRINACKIVVLKTERRHWGDLCLNAMII